MRRARLAGVAWALIALGLGCGEDVCRPAGEVGQGTALRFSPGFAAPGHFWDHPWPSDARRRPGGGLILESFPNPTGSTTLPDYISVIGAHTDAFGKNAAVYLGFTGPLDADALPAQPASAVDSDASLYLVDIDPGSPERGRRFPLDVRYGAEPTVYLEAHHVALKPPYGLPLADATTYAVVGTDRLTAGGEPIEVHADLSNALRCEAQAVPSLWSALAPLRAWLDEEGIDADEVRAATVFTTQDVVHSQRELAAFVRALPAPALEGLRFVEPRGDVNVYEATIELPGLQSGRRPYSAPRDGGRIELDADGKPSVTHTQTTRISINLPRNQTMPAGGWPVVLYGHGTWGDYMSVVTEELADELGAMGIATVGYDQVLHGPRDPTGSDPGLSFINISNVVAARDNLRQGALDGVVMTNLLSGLTVPASVTHTDDQRFDPARIAFLGHSQGGVEAAGFVATEPRLRAAAFSGTSGVIAIPLMVRKDPVDFQGLLRTLLALPPEETIDELHPIISLIQTFIEPGDPINFARSYRRDPAGPDGVDVLFLEGFLDPMSPAAGHEALAAAAGAPLIEPAHRNPLASALSGLSPQGAPASGNVTLPSGAEVTMGLIQYPEEGHYPLFRDDDARRRVLRFLQTALMDGRAVIEASASAP